MCGVLAIFSREPVAQYLHDGLVLLQHRGQDAAGIFTYDQGKIYRRKANGLVRDVFRQEHLENLKGNVGIAHVRYPTAGTSADGEAQPFYVNSPYGITLAHNGNLVNSEQLIKELFNQDRRHINTGSDSEILLNILAHELLGRKSLMPDSVDVFAAVRRLHHRVRGSYAAVALITGFGLLAFRDPNAIRPLVFGIRETATGKEYMVASESVALSVAGFELVRDIEPGEAIFIDQQGQFYNQQCSDSPAYHSCIFEYVYFARPDSKIDKVFVHQARMRMGASLAKKIKKQWPNHQTDVVIPVPDTSRTAALELAVQLGVRYREGFIKNRYIGRTFIMPWQQERQKSVRQKLNPLEIEFKDKNVMIVDDSIVRGTTSKEIVQMARDAGAKKVYLISASPPVCYPNVYGIDMPVPEELIAHGRTQDEICKLIGADQLIYQDLDSLIHSVKYYNPRLREFDCSIFNGHYVVRPGTDYLNLLEQKRCDQSKERDVDTLDLRSVM